MISLTENGKTILTIFLMIVLMVILFALVGFYNFNEDFWIYTIGSGERTCSSLFRCALLIFDLVSETGLGLIS